MRIELIVNSAASSVTARRRVVIQKALSADHEVRLAETTRRGHATGLAQAAARDGADVAVVLGGDGTLNEAANGLAGTGTALAALPGGSTNVFARILGTPDDPVDAVGWLLDALDANSITKIGLGAAAGRHFLFHCGVGFDAAVVQQVERRGHWKRWAGHPLFVYAAINTWLRRRNRRRPPMEVHTGAAGPSEAGFGEAGSGEEGPGEHNPGEHRPGEHKGLFTVALNANPYTYIGDRAFNLVPDLEFSDPLALVIIEDLALWRLGPTALRALGAGDIRSMSGVTVRANQTRATIVADPPVAYQLDGDYIGEVSRLELTWTPDALRLVTGPPSAEDS